VRNEFREVNFRNAHSRRSEIAQGAPRERNSFFQCEGDQNSHCDPYRRGFMRDGFISCARGQISVQFIPNARRVRARLPRGMW